MAPCAVAPAEPAASAPQNVQVPPETLIRRGPPPPPTNAPLISSCCDESLSGFTETGPCGWQVAGRSRQQEPYPLSYLASQPWGVQGACLVFLSISRGLCPADSGLCSRGDVLDEGG
ncbi:hypothetical protein NDU88_004643 [Pleurodeles waltl]|uniref:Uncharacterized protein n=1 Tax=Pleurodeles waltl TaxID=8319 RepID=A0AAV7V1R4_PLEWA|nr:hypothetical protein NDU88_004643 [Pleurodeles waltl]